MIVRPYDEETDKYALQDLIEQSEIELVDANKLYFYILEKECAVIGFFAFANVQPGIANLYHFFITKRERNHLTALKMFLSMLDFIREGGYRQMIYHVCEGSRLARLLEVMFRRYKRKLIFRYEPYTYYQVEV
jgi:hypothetical protein